MQRPLKFRAWTGEKMRPCAVSQDGKAMMDFGPSNAPLMEWTGLKDKNGKEAYEGDIIRHSERELPSRIIWDEQENGFRLLWPQTLSFAKIGKRFEVIGNIYENPELLQAN